MGIGEKKAQVSVEYMFLIGFATLITIPLIIIYQSFIQDSREEIASVQIIEISKKVIDAAESVYYLGEPSQTTLRVNIPHNIVAVDLEGGSLETGYYEVIFNISTKSGIVEIVQNSAVNITGSLPINKGTYTITVKAKSDHVNVSYR